MMASTIELIEGTGKGITTERLHEVIEHKSAKQAAVGWQHSPYDHTISLLVYLFSLGITSEHNWRVVQARREIASLVNTTLQVGTPLSSAPESWVPGVAAPFILLAKTGTSIRGWG